MATQLELACFHPDAVAAAQDLGVHRVEFCAHALLGGTSPSSDEVARARRAFDGPLGVMVRPRGGDFEYSFNELDVMRDELKRLADQGVDFAVMGALHNGQLDPRCGDLVAEANLPVVLHRAFDDIRQPLSALEDAISMGFSRILTGLGGQSIDALIELKYRAHGRIEILPGGGIRSHNVAQYIDAGFGYVHSAALTDAAYQSNIPMPDPSEVAQIIERCTTS